MLSSDWLAQLLSGQLEIALPTASVVQGDGCTFTGSGRVAWQTDSELRVSGVTDGGQTLFERFGLAWSPGKLIPHGDYIRLTGDTQDGWELRTDPVPLDGYSLQWNSSAVVWNFTTRGLSLHRRPGIGPEHRVIRALLGPPPRTWTRYTETEVRSEQFPSRSYRMDWLMSSLSFGTLAARQRSDDLFEIKIVINGTPARTEALDIVVAVARAFSFVLGRYLPFLGYEDVTRSYETRYLAALINGAKRTKLPQPLGDGTAYQDGVEQLLARAVEFFLSDPGERVAGYLHLCWDTADNHVSTRVAVASISLEGLLRIASAGERAVDESYTTADVNMMTEWLKASTCQLSNRFVARVRGFLGALAHRRPVDILRDWETRGVLGVTRDDVVAWERARNPAAHGALLTSTADGEKMQALLSRFYRVLNLVNRVVLQLIEYQGKYRDYAKPGWPEVEFPAARGEEL